ncbi:hypothetical protein BJV82DRAFT_632326 [Fennellomyces sp. T-0311]|nr:hypothetical protein BJV82DRAFT_632326 [Fennellomyces sp. T-0311]
MKSTGRRRYIWEIPANSNRISMTVVLCHYLHCFFTCGLVKLCLTGLHHEIKPSA